MRTTKLTNNPNRQQTTMRGLLGFGGVAESLGGASVDADADADAGGV